MVQLLPNDFFELAKEQLSEGNTVRLRVQGNSMLPFIHSGDVVVIEPYLQEDLPLYTAVFYQWKGQFMTHRLISKSVKDNDHEMWSMLGDGNISQVETLEKSEILGVLTLLCHEGKEFSCVDHRWLRLGRLWHILLPIRRILLWLYKRLL